MPKLDVGYKEEGVALDRQKIKKLACARWIRNRDKNIVSFRAERIAVNYKGKETEKRKEKRKLELWISGLNDYSKYNSFMACKSIEK